MLHTKTISELKAGYASGEFTPSDVINSLEEAILKGDDKVGAFLSRDLESALARAEQADLSLPLGGIPIAIKDNINVEGEPCTCASKFLEGSYTAPYNATVINKVIEAGAIPFGRANLDEFAMGSATENSALQVTRNPRDLDRVPGGSSGGSAACVAADFAISALGSDTGGSIRQPASHCGVVGFKPSYGRVSRYGLVAFASSLDQIGPITKSVTDAAIMTNALSGHDPLDSTSLEAPEIDFTAGLDDGVKGKKIGVPTEYLSGEIHPDVKANVEKAIKTLEEAGAEIVEVSLPHTKYCVPTYYILAPAEASSNLSRFDGVRYGTRSQDVTDVHSMYENSRVEGFGPEVKRRILLGTYVLSSGYYDAYYLKAQKVRTLIKQDFQEVFTKVDALIAPVAPEPARKICAEEAEDPLKEYLADIFTIGANLAGIPAISVPCGTASVDGKDLPVGLQILGPHMGDQVVLQVARAWEMLQG